MLTDPITDYLNRIRNALQAEHEEVEIPASRLKREMSRILKEQGYITDFTIEPGRVGEVIKVRLRYTQDRSPVITGMERVSRPGRRRYVAKEDVPRVFGGMGTTIMSTSRGVMTGHEARQRGVGGEVVAHVWLCGDEPNRKKANPDPRGRRDRRQARRRHGQGAEGRAQPEPEPRHEGLDRGRHVDRRAPDRPRRAPCPPRPH